MAEPAVAAVGAGADPGPAEGLRQPDSCGQLFRVFTRLALQGFGGVLPVAHRTLVERERWLSADGFVALLALSQVLPGPNIVNLALMFGDRHFGWRGALSAAAGLMAIPMLIVLALGTLAAQVSDIAQVSAALRGMGAVAAGLVIATGLKLTRTLRRNPLGRPLGLGLALLAALAVGALRWPMVPVVLVLGGLGMALAAWRLGRGS